MSKPAKPNKRSAADAPASKQKKKKKKKATAEEATGKKAVGTREKVQEAVAVMATLRSTEAASPPLARPIPAVGPARRPPLPAVLRSTLENGLDVMVVRRTGVPLVEVRLVLPTVRAKVAPVDRARQRVLGATLLAGTSARSTNDIQAMLQQLGGSLSAGADVEDLSLAGSALADGFDPLVGLIAEVLTDAAFPAAEVATERARAQQELVLSASQPAVLARRALVARYYGEHPYGHPDPDADLVGAVTPAALRRYVASRVGPAGGTLVVVGDVDPRRALAAAEAALGGWSTSSTPSALPVPVPASAGPVLLVDRPGAVQTNIRLLGPAVPRRHPRSAALAVTNSIFGGSFTSRLTANLREDKGYTYSPGSGVTHNLVDSTLTVVADVATAVTAPALVEILHELGRLATVRVTGDEVERAGRYLIGTNALSIQTQRGLATTLAVLASHALDVEHLKGLPDRIAAVTVDDVAEAAAAHLAPTGFVVVLVGDAEQIVPSVARVAQVEVLPAT